MVQTKTIAILLLIVIATIGTIGIGTATQSAQACPTPPCHQFDFDDVGNGQSFHDVNGDLHSNGHA